MDPVLQRNCWKRRFGAAFGAALLIILAWFVGAAGLDSPWILGDEFAFIVDNPDVSADHQRSLPEHVAQLYAHTQDDLYQPTLIAFLAILWAAVGDSPWWFRAADLSLHAINAALLWFVLCALAAQYTSNRPSKDNPQPPTKIDETTSAPSGLLCAALWCVAALWALHPANVATYAADLGTGHLLAAGLLLIAMLLHLRVLRTNTAPALILMLVVLFFANTAKAAPGWFLVVAAVEAALLGVGPMLRSPRVWLVGALSAVFAVLTIYTTTESGLLDETSAGLFGDPISRSLLAVWYYTRNTLMPLWLSPWYIPDPATGWSHPLVWLGAVVVGVCVLLARRGWRNERSRLTIVGWMWLTGALLPVIGLIGARQGIAFDRYLYQPLMALALLCAFAIAGAATTPGGMPRARGVQILIGLGCAVVLLACMQTGAPLIGPPILPVAPARDAVLRAEHVVAENPDDPRAMEMLAATTSFARTHRVTATQLSVVRAATGADGADAQYAYFNRGFVNALTRAAAADPLKFFPDGEQRARFHRRLATWYISLGDGPTALRHAEESRQLAPEAGNTWLVLARANRLLGRLDEARAAYEKREALLPKQTRAQAIHYIEYGDLLLKYLGDPAAAKPRYEAAVATGEMRTPALIGLALCEIRVGVGEHGLRIIETALQQAPHNRDARLALAEYHLRSHHWKEAATAYGDLVRENPTLLDALLGLHEVANQTSDWAAALAAWDRALRLEPENRAFRSFYAWAAVCAGLPGAGEIADALLEIDARNPLAPIAKMLIAVRANEIEPALAWLEKASSALSAGEFVQSARPLERGLAAVRILRTRPAAPDGAAIVEAAVRRMRGDTDGAKQTLDEFLRDNSQSKWRELAEHERARLN